jgi:hypothetical protein
VQAGAKLKTYLQDHHAGSTTGLELARRAARSNADDPAYGPELARIATEIDEDRETLERLMDHLGTAPHRIKDLGAWAFEKLGRLKPNNSLLSYSPLSRVVELEGLALGVTGKLALWRALREVLGDAEGEFDFVALAARAEDQQRRLEGLRLKAVAEALAAD